MKSVSITHSAISRWILLKEDPAWASVPKADANLVYVASCALKKAHISKVIALPGAYSFRNACS